jgi:hypothetical protein
MSVNHRAKWPLNMSTTKTARVANSLQAVQDIIRNGGITQVARRRAWRFDRARTFAAVAGDRVKLMVPPIEAAAGHVQPFDARSPLSFTGHRMTVIWVGSWPAHVNWQHVLYCLCFCASEQYVSGATRRPYRVVAEQLVKLWHRFWIEAIPVADLQLAAAHQLIREEEAAISGVNTQAAEQPAEAGDFARGRPMSLFDGAEIARGT